MTNRKSFIIHKDSLDILDKLSDEQAGKLFKAIYFYQKTQKIPQLDFALDLVFTSFFNQFKRDDENYKITCEARKIAGSKGGKQKVANASNCLQKVANLADSKNESESDSKNKSNQEYIINSNNILIEKNITKKENNLENDFCKEVIDTLQEHLQTTLNKKIITTNWQKQIEFLLDKDLKPRGIDKAKQDIITCMQAVIDNHKEDYFPVINSASAFREKFSKIEDFLKRKNNFNNNFTNGMTAKQKENRQAFVAFGNNKQIF
jgi:uncharacterized protein with gpF-like domain